MSYLTIPIKRLISRRHFYLISLFLPFFKILYYFSIILTTIYCYSVNNMSVRPNNLLNKVSLRNSYFVIRVSFFKCICIGVDMTVESFILKKIKKLCLWSYSVYYVCTNLYSTLSRHCFIIFRYLKDKAKRSAFICETSQWDRRTRVRI